MVGSGPNESQTETEVALRAMRRAAADAVAGLAGEFLLLATFLTASGREFASRRLQYPVVNAVANQLKRFSLGHAGLPPSTLRAVVCLVRPASHYQTCGSIVPAIDAFNGLFRIV